MAVYIKDTNTQPLLLPTGTFSGDTSIDENINAQSPDVQIQDTQESPEQYANMNFTDLGSNGIIDKQNLSEPDPLPFLYPKFADKINRALQKGADRKEIVFDLAKIESLALLKHKPEEVNEFLGRTDRKTNIFWELMDKQQDDMFIEAMRHKMPMAQVRRNLSNARIRGINPALLLTNPDFAKEVDENLGPDRNAFMKAIASISNMASNYITSKADVNEMEASKLRYGEVSEQSNAQAATDPNRYWQDGRSQKEIDLEKAENYEWLARIERRIGEALHMDYRPPESAFWRGILEGIESSGFTVSSSIKSSIAYVLGGPIAGILGSAYLSYEEAQSEAGGVFKQALQNNLARGMDMEAAALDAVQRARGTRNDNLLFLPASNLTEDLIFHNKFVEKGIADLAMELIPGSGALRAFGRMFIQGGVQALAGGVIEGNEELQQKKFEMQRLGLEIDDDKLMEDFKRGYYSSILYSI